MNAEAGTMQVFTVHNKLVAGSRRATYRRTPQEAIEQLVLAIDEEAVVDVAGVFEQH